MKRLVWIAITVVTLLLIVGGAMASQFNLSALPEPDKMETFIASKAKHYLVRRASRVGIPPALTDMQASITEGDKLFGTECSECHGDNGRRPTDAGRWMYPRAADLACPLSEESNPMSISGIWYISSRHFRTQIRRARKPRIENKID